MRILYFTPHLNTVYAGRTISNGYKNAFIDLGHDFRFMSTEDNQRKVYEEFGPHIIFVSLNSYYLRFLDLQALKRQKSKGSKIFVNTPFWTSPFSKLRINEAPSLKDNDNWLKLIKSGDFGDIYYNSSEQEDPRMEGFTETTGYSHHTIPLGADKTVIYPEFSEKFVTDISYIGTNLPQKKEFMQKQVLPLKNKYILKLYGQDWTFKDKMISLVSKAGKYFNLPALKDLQKPTLNIEDERKIYSSSVISINIHEDYQRKYGGDCNERTFKIPLAGGFEITDNVACIHKYFKEGEEIVIAKNKSDWFDKIEYYIKNPEKRDKIIEAGRKRVLKDHTYHNRVTKILNIYEQI